MQGLERRFGRKIRKSEETVISVREDSAKTTNFVKRRLMILWCGCSVSLPVDKFRDSNVCLLTSWEFWCYNTDYSRWFRTVQPENLKIFEWQIESEREKQARLFAGTLYVGVPKSWLCVLKIREFINSEQCVITALGLRCDSNWPNCRGSLY